MEHGLALQCGSRIIRSDREIVMAAVYQNPAVRLTPIQHLPQTQTLDLRRTGLRRTACGRRFLQTRFYV